MFLIRNGYNLVATDADKIETFLGLAGGEISEAELANWIRAHWMTLERGS